MPAVFGAASVGTLELDVVAGLPAFTSAEDVVAYVRACICSGGSGA